MQFHYETIKQEGHIPIKIFTQLVEFFPYHWHEETEILFILKGSIEIMIDKQGTILNVGDIFLVNRNEIHFIRSLDQQEGTHLLILQFNLQQFRRFGVETGVMRFRLNSGDHDLAREKEYDRIRTLLASLMKVVINREEPQRLLVERHLLDLLIILTSRFSMPEQSDDMHVREDDQRLLEILKYINAQSADSSLSLNQIAERFFLTPPYLSTYFKTNMGISVKKFIENIRLNKSLRPLKLTDRTIVEIALEYGFPDAKSYYRVFREVLGTTPTVFRELQSVDVSSERPKDYFSINSKETLAELFKYADLNEVDQRQFHEVMPARSVVYEARTDIPGADKLRHTWTRLMTFGYALHGLRSDFRDQLRILQRDIGFEYVRFHGIFADELLIYNERSDGSVYYNFNHIDTLLDNLIGEGVRPFLELGFMPTQLASSDGEIFWWKANVTPPKDTVRWLDLIEAFIRHLLNRFGIAEVTTWYFEFWNEPDIEGVFWKGSREQFFEFFRESFERLKAIDSRLRIGGFGNLSMVGDGEWLRDFAKYARKHDLKLDFYSFHVYHLSRFTNVGETSLAAAELLADSNFDDHFHSELLNRLTDVRLGDANTIPLAVEQELAGSSILPMTTSERWITEWNANTDCRDLVHDTCYMAAFIVRMALRIGQKVEGLGFWTATDLHEEFRLPQPLFHGGFGLMTYNGIKKAGFHASSFLAKLGDEIVLQKEGVIVTRRGDEYQVLFYHYCHYNELYDQFDYSQLSQTSRYGVFLNTDVKEVGLRLHGLNGKYVIEEQWVNRNQGSSYDAWVEMGGPDMLSAAGYQHLNRRAEPGYRTRIELAQNILELKATLEPHEIRLLIINRKY
jgi:xylan 1,4-beta-xylosidase